MDPGSVLQNYKASVKSRTADCASVPHNVDLPVNTGVNADTRDNVLNLPQDIQGFLNSLPANVSDLPILVIRKQGAGKCL